MKRLFDFTSSLIGLIFLSPLFLIIGIVIKCTSKGPIFFRQIRVGKDRVNFKILKFRTMYLDSEKHGQITVGGHDPRVTSIGYYLRKYKLDELPQLINVLIGDMSLVGPRPEVPKYVKLYNEEQLQVLSVRPGITDLASLEFRNENELLAQYDDPDRGYIEEVMPRKLELNLKYIENSSMFSDLKIIFTTILKCVR